VSAKEVTRVTADAPGFRNNNLVQEVFWTRTGLPLLAMLMISGTSLAGVTLTEDSFRTLVGRFQNFRRDFTVVARLGS
jgi:hypothetical protein